MGGRGCLFTKKSIQSILGSFTDHRYFGSSYNITGKSRHPVSLAQHKFVLYNFPSAFKLLLKFSFILSTFVAVLREQNKVITASTERSFQTPAVSYLINLSLSTTKLFLCDYHIRTKDHNKSGMDMCILVPWVSAPRIPVNILFSPILLLWSLTTV